MNENLVRVTQFSYACALAAQAMLLEEKFNIIQNKIEVPLNIMYKFYLKNVFQATFVPINTMLKAIELPMPYRLNKKTRPPIIQ